MPNRIINLKLLLHLQNCESQHNIEGYLYLLLQSKFKIKKIITLPAKDI